MTFSSLINTVIAGKPRLYTWNNTPDQTKLCIRCRHDLYEKQDQIILLNSSRKEVETDGAVGICHQSVNKYD